MSNIERMNWPVPDNNKKSWYSDFTSLVESQAAAAYSAREDRSIVLCGGGSRAFNSGTGVFSWSSAILLISPISGVTLTVNPGSIVITDSQWCFVSLVRNPLTPATVIIKVAGALPGDNDSFAIGVRLGAALALRPFWAAP